MYLIRISRMLLGLALLGLAMLHISGMRPIEFVSRLDQVLYDLRLRSNLQGGRDQRIVIVDIDEQSLAAEGRWPWHRDKMGFLVDMLFDYYAVRLLAMDVVFVEPDDPGDSSVLAALSKPPWTELSEVQEAVQAMRRDFDYDAILGRSLKNRPVVLGYFIGRGQDNTSGMLPAPVARVEDLGFNDGFYEAGSYSANLPILQHATRRAGFLSNPLVDPDGVFRRFPLLAKFDGNVYESFPLAVVRELLHSNELGMVSAEGYGDGARLEHLRVDAFDIPVDEQAAILVPYRGRFGSFDYISATEVLNGLVEPERLKGKIAILGGTASGLVDLRATPVQNVFPGVEIHANAISGILDQTLRSRPAYIAAWELVAAFAGAAIAIMLFPMLSAIWMSLLLALLVALLLGGDYYAWQQLAIAMHSAATLLLLLSIFLMQLFYGYVFETRRKQRLGRIFGQYVPPEIVKQMSAVEAVNSLSGESREMSVLFSDVCGFTTVSEALESEELCELINALFTPLTQVIHRHGGTIDKYIGDAIMAFWGAPLREPDHAGKSVAAALAMIQTLAEVQTRLAARGWPALSLGIGINTGRMSVGNMGSEFRMAYTVMGDAVNLGSRLEGLTRHYGVGILASESTRLAAPAFLYREVDTVRVKGRAQPLTIYEPLVLAAAATAAQLKECAALQAAQALFRARNWEAARAHFSELSRSNPEAALYPLYLGRIEHFESNPPPADWNGVHEWSAK